MSPLQVHDGIVAKHLSCHSTAVADKQINTKMMHPPSTFHYKMAWSNNVNEWANKAKRQNSFPYSIKSKRASKWWGGGSDVFMQKCIQYVWQLFGLKDAEHETLVVRRSGGAESPTLVPVRQVVWRLSIIERVPWSWQHQKWLLTLCDVSVRNRWYIPVIAEI